MRTIYVDAIEPGRITGIHGFDIKLLMLIFLIENLILLMVYTYKRADFNNEYGLCTIRPAEGIVKLLFSLSIGLYAHKPVWFLLEHKTQASVLLIRLTIIITAAIGSYCLINIMIKPDGFNRIKEFLGSLKLKRKAV